MHLRWTVFAACVLLFLVTLAGCQASPTPTSIPPTRPAPTFTDPAPLPASPSPALTSSPTASETPSPTPSPAPSPTQTSTPLSLPRLQTPLTLANAASLQEVASWGSGALQSARLIAGGEVILVRTRDEIHLLRADTLERVTRLTGVAQTLLSADERLLVIAPEGENRLDLWRLPEGELFASLEHPVEEPRFPPETFSFPDYRSVKTLAFSPDESLLAAGFGNAEIVIWRTADWEQAAVLQSNISNVSSRLVFEAQNRYLLSNEGMGALGEFVGNPRLVFWDLSDFSLRGYIPDPGYVSSRPFSSDSSYLLTTASFKVFVWNVFDFSLLRTFAAGSELGYQPDVFFSPDDQYVIVANQQVRSAQDGIRLNPTEEAAFLAELGLGDETLAPAVDRSRLENAGYYPAFQGLSLLEDGRQVIAWGSQETRLYWLRLPEETFTTVELGSRPMNRAVLTQDESALALCLDSGDLAVVELKSSLIQLYPGCRQNGRLAFLPDGRQLRTNGMLVDVLPFPDGAVTNSLRGHTADVKSLFVQPDGALILTGAQTVGEYAGVNLWTSEPALALLESFPVPDLFPNPTSGVETLSISPDAAQFVAAGPSRGVYAYHLPGNYLLWTAEAGQALDLAYSPDGSLLAVGTSRAGLQLIETARGELVYAPPIAQVPSDFMFDPPAFAPRVLDVEFLPDATGIYSTGEDGMVHLWGAP